jgi:SAM-dependent methyltransferase
MSDSVSRFSTRVEDYAKFRPGYPPEILELLKRECGLNPSSIIADIGSGTGILSELFLKNGNEVQGIEPNPVMRKTAEPLLSPYSNFVSVPGSAEDTTLGSDSVDFITAGQAFHWFKRDEAKTEFARILRPNGWVVLLWNERRTNSTPFLRDYEQLLLRFGTDYQQVRHENVKGAIEEFFAPLIPKVAHFDNVQLFDYEGLEGRSRSASYTPEPGHPNFDLMYQDLRELFSIHATEGHVAFEYDTTVHYGHFPAA